MIITSFKSPPLMHKTGSIKLLNPVNQKLIKIGHKIEEETNEKYNLI